MCCKSFIKNWSGHFANCCDRSAVSGPLFWSEKKKIQMVKDSINCLQSQIKDLEECLLELKEKKEM